MSEVERRTKYVEGRILIDAARVLSSPFYDGVLYFTGAQIEVLRNLAHYADRIETFVDEYDATSYLVPDNDDWDDIQAIIADLEETLMGNPNTLWGYASGWNEEDTEVSTGESYTQAETAAVPAGYVYVLEHWTVLHNQGTALGVTLKVDGANTLPTLFDAPALASMDLAYGTTHITLTEDDHIHFRVYGLSSGKNAILRAWGHKMIVPE